MLERARGRPEMLLGVRGGRLRRRTSETELPPEFGRSAGDGEDDGAEDAPRLGKPKEVYVDVRRSSGIAQKVFLGSGLLWKRRKWQAEVGV